MPFIDKTSDTRHLQSRVDTSTTSRKLHWYVTHDHGLLTYIFLGAGMK